MRLPKHQARLLFGTSAVDKAMTAWLEICDSIVHQSHVSLAMGQAAIARLFTIFDEVMAGLDQSFMVYKDDALVYQATGRVIDLVLGVLLSILIILLYLAIISPSVRNMVACGEGTEQMLRSIPEDIVRKVPAIASYLQIAGSEAVEVRAAMMKSEKLLRNILPPSITARLKKGESPIGDSYFDVTLMFTDMVGFTSMSGNMGAAELVTLLDSVFGAYDKLVECRGLEKIKTAGDAYIMAGNLFKHPANVHVVCVEAGLKTYEVLHQLNHQNKTAKKLQQRCGLHTGTVVGGVLGHTTLAFDLWGVDVQFAACMESHGVPGKVQISKKLYERVKHHYSCSPRQVEVPGHGMVTTYIVNGDKRMEAGAGPRRRSRVPSNAGSSFSRPHN
jgi:class 3 adenylate cyclase